MKFLTIGTFKDTVSALPQAEKTKLNLAAVEYILAFKKKMGNKWHFYMDPGGNRAISIGEYSSIEEYSQSLQSPAAAAGYMNYESIPLIEGDEKALKAWVDSQKAAKKK
jgi:hypothetical protein